MVSLLALRSTFLLQILPHLSLTQRGRGGRVSKVNHRYGHDRANLAHSSHDQLTAGFTDILTGCVPLLRPGGIVAVTARPYRTRGELVDIPGMVVAAGHAAGLTLIDRCVALIAAVRNGQLVPRASFFQLHNIRLAHQAGDPQWLLQHELVHIFQATNKIGKSSDPGTGTRQARRR